MVNNTIHSRKEQNCGPARFSLAFLLPLVGLLSVSCLAAAPNREAPADEAAEDAVTGPSPVHTALSRLGPGRQPLPQYRRQLPLVRQVVPEPPRSMSEPAKG